MNFLIDENATIGSVLTALKIEGVKTSDVAKAIEGISEKPLRNALKQAGYVFQNKAPKGWHYVGKGEQPLSKSIFDYVKQSNTQVKRNSHEVMESNIQVNPSNTRVKGSSPEVIESNTQVNPSNTRVKENSHKVIESNTQVKPSNTDFTESSLVIHPQFTRDEISDLMAMLHEWRNNKLATSDEVGDSLHNRIKQLPKGEKTRKTIVIDKSVGERLDRYCESEKVNKSDILHLALMDFLDRH